MSSTETMISDVVAGRVCEAARAIPSPPRHDRVVVILFEIIVSRPGDAVNDERASQSDGQLLLWLIAVGYLALVLVLYFGVYLALKAYSALTAATVT